MTGSRYNLQVAFASFSMLITLTKSDISFVTIIASDKDNLPLLDSERTLLQTLTSLVLL